MDHVSCDLTKGFDVEIIHEERFIPFTLLEIFLKDMTSQ